ncbi:MAG: type II secretion system GspH family protein [Candidatus Roizmanbacteria bacterium]|nr:type II secretion system GspH family protein [Candidatus Roizmanbacteria bacterium]
MKKINKFNSARMHGFTLVELLVVIGILAILTAVVLVAVNPGKQLQQARNTERRAEVNTILSAITAFLADPDNTATLPDVQLCSLGPVAVYADATAVAPDVNLSGVAPIYVAALPEDPTTGGVDLGDTGYEICLADATNQRYRVSAPAAEGGITVEVER